MNRNALRLVRLMAGVELLTAAGLWGFGFIASVWVLRETNPFELTFLRFALAALVLVPLALTASGRAAMIKYARPALLPAILLSGLLILQTWGLQYTTATKSGFITTLYVVIVPMLEAVFYRKRISTFLWICVGVSIVGTGLIVDVSLDSFNRGDAMTAVSAIFAAFQILAIGKVSRTIDRPLIFNCMQALWGALIALPFALMAGSLTTPVAMFAWPLTSLLGILCLGFGSTVIAFALQLRAQARLSPTVSSLLFLLESPFALIFAIWLLGEHLNAREMLGAAMIFLSAVIAISR